MRANDVAENTQRSPLRPGPRSAATREAIVSAAERLFAEQGLGHVSHREISAAAGQGNVAAVNYHFGSTGDLVRTIIARHTEAIELLRRPQLEAVEGSTDLRDWLACLFHPIAAHLEALGSPTWWARLSAQLVTDPRRLARIDSVMGSETQRTARRVMELLPDLPDAVRTERSDMTRLLAVHTFAEREAALADGQPTPRSTWQQCADGLVDATVGLWQAPHR